MAKAPRSLTQRLLLASLVCLPLYLAATGAFLARSFETSQLASAGERLRVQFYALLGSVEFDADGLRVNSRAGDPRLRQLNSGLYAVVHRPRGQVLWQSPSSESLDLDRPEWSQKLLGADAPPNAGDERFDTLSGSPPYLRYQFYIVWELENGEDVPLVFTVLETQTMLNDELRAFLRQLWLWLGGAALMLTLAQAAILHWGLRPLRKLAQDVSELEQGSSAGLSEGYPAELQPLAANLNQLLNREQHQRERYRNTLADLAHSLKTPLAILRQAATADRPDRALLDEQIGRMDQLIGYQLQRAVASGAQPLGQQLLPLRPLVQKLLGSFEKVYFDKKIRFDIQIDPAYECRADEGDLMEVLGNLIDNACKACRQHVAVNARSGERRLLISIEDDGSGVEPTQRRRILERGQRSDSYEPGQGIGLAVAVDILDSYGAELDIDHSQLGGARFTVRWPRH